MYQPAGQISYNSSTQSGGSLVWGQPVLSILIQQTKQNIFFFFQVARTMMFTLPRVASIFQRVLYVGKPAKRCSQTTTGTSSWCPKRPRGGGGSNKMLFSSSGSSSGSFQEQILADAVAKMRIRGQFYHQLHHHLHYNVPALSCVTDLGICRTAEQWHGDYRWLQAPEQACFSSTRPLVPRSNPDDLSLSACPLPQTTTKTTTQRKSTNTTIHPITNMQIFL